MTLKEFRELTKDMPEDMPIMMYSGCFYRQIEFVKKQKLWVDGEQIEVVWDGITKYVVEGLVK